MLRDSFGREICYLRISLTDRCNLRCIYCMPEEGIPLVRHEDVLRFEEIETFLQVAAEEGIKQVRLTGGEPLLRRGIVELVNRLKKIAGIEDLSLTTNALLLPELAKPLRQAGLKRINIGLPSLDRDGYRTITRRDELPRALKGLEVALSEGFHPVKINVVVLKEINDDLLPFLELTRQLPIHVRFIEYMPLGGLIEEHRFVDASSMYLTLKRKVKLQEAEKPAGRGPALRHFSLTKAVGTISFIAPRTQHICSRCNRLRLTSEGHLRLCLFSEKELDLKEALRPLPEREKIRVMLKKAVELKPQSMKELTSPSGRAMSQIGG